MPKLVFNYANKYLHVTFVFDDGQHFSAHKGFKHLLYHEKSNYKAYNATHEIVPMTTYFKALCRSLTQGNFFSTYSGFLF